MGRKNRFRDGKDDTRKYRDVVFARDGYKCVVWEDSCAVYRSYYRHKHRWPEHP